ncbi:MAG: acetate kinase [Bacteroidetes bacterium]|nr:acetate kinase [Bacteroidota bacterium]
MNIIVLNCGSSSIKSQMLIMPEGRVGAKILIDKVGLKGGNIKYYDSEGKAFHFQREISNHQKGIECILEMFTNKTHGCISDLAEIHAVGHRVVHAGEKYSGSVILNEDVIKALEECIDLAPLHNPPNLEGIYAMQKIMPGIPQVGVFDTAFHQTMKAWAYLYGIPYNLYEKYKIRRYGFHGTSHRYVARRAAKILGKELGSLKMITCHLGNGSSIAAVKNGQSIDTSMGMTPLEGLIMGTRCGDLDIGALLHVAEKENLSLKGIHKLVNKQSGMLGISGVSSDMRDIETAAENGHQRAKIALEMFAYRVKKYIGAYAAAMGGLDAIVFTGGIGENDTATRQRVMEDMEFFGISFDREKNQAVRSQEAFLTQQDSKVHVLVIPTNEELVIAEDTYELVLK